MSSSCQQTVETSSQKPAARRKAVLDAAWRRQDADLVQALASLLADDLHSDLSLCCRDGERREQLCVLHHNLVLVPGRPTHLWQHCVTRPQPGACDVRFSHAPVTWLCTGRDYTTTWRS